MKHPPPRPSTDPEALAATVYELVAAEVGRLDIAVPPAFLPRVRKHAELLATWGAVTNLTARPEDPSAIAFHVIDSLMPLHLANRDGPPALRRAFTAGHQVLDVGSGAGFPGLVLASASQARFTLVEARRKRASFLTVTSEEMGLFDLSVRSDRVAPATFDPVFDLAITRALEAAGDFHVIARAALKHAGLAMLYAGPRQAAQLAGRRFPGFERLSGLSYQLARTDEPVGRVALVWRKQ